MRESNHPQWVGISHMIQQENESCDWSPTAKSQAYFQMFSILTFLLVSHLPRKMHGLATDYIVWVSPDPERQMLKILYIDSSLLPFFRCEYKTWRKRQGRSYLGWLDNLMYVFKLEFDIMVGIFSRSWKKLCMHFVGLCMCGRTYVVVLNTAMFI